MPNPLTYKSTGACCRKARPFFSVRETPQSFIVDFTNSKKRQGKNIESVKILLRNGRTYKILDDYSDVVIIEGKEVHFSVHPPVGVYSISVRCKLDDPLRSLMTQDINIRVSPTT